LDARYLLRAIRSDDIDMVSPRACFFAGLGLLLLATTGCARSENRVVLYCAQDEQFARHLFDDFRQQTGLTVEPKFDNEATKSVGLYVELVREASRPRCDLYWNNEILNTIRLQQQGLLQPYASPAAQPYPASCRGPGDAWHAFAERARVLIVNTKLVPEADRPRSLLDLTQSRWKGRVAMAKPQYGTTATQAACLFEVLGPENARAYYRGLQANGIAISGGNKQVAENVGEGRYAIGVTDTDDAIDEVKAGHPVVIIFPDRDAPADSRMGTLFIPNTVAIMKGAPHPEAARKLVDFLLSPEVEKRLAEADSAQIPMNPNVKATLPPQIAAGRDAKRMQVDWQKAAGMWDEVQKFLAEEFARP
jgi:iron(III) transport system substrate-binding protein